jgi:hypothetical protein
MERDSLNNSQNSCITVALNDFSFISFVAVSVYNFETSSSIQAVWGIFKEAVEACADLIHFLFNEHFTFLFYLLLSSENSVLICLHLYE